MTKIRSPFEIYRKLFKDFGPQGWWPVTRTGEAKEKNKPAYYPLSYNRDTENKKFEICLGAILTQNTSWKNVEKAIVNLNSSNILSVNKINSVKKSYLCRLIRPSGYYNQKAERLKAFSSYILKKYEGKISRLFDENTEAARKELLSLSGIGPETADSMLLYAANKPVFVVDAYTLRIGKRVGWFGDGSKGEEGHITGRKEKDYDIVQRYFLKKLPESFKVYNEFHALLVELGKNYCRKKPLCTGCPIRQMCKYTKRKLPAYANRVINPAKRDGYSPY
ncbi:MAG: hypothetical protein LHV68_09455 [Elusimicrobia bacterium]|nr:hypothetical protein [Candidatus Liberimonas magnetica]